MTDDLKAWAVRPAHRRDRAAIQLLLSGFRRESSRPLTQLQQIGLWVTVGVVGAIALHRLATTSAIGLMWLNQVLQQVLTLAFWVGLSFAMAYFLSSDWRYYWVLECNGEVIGCARLGNYVDHSVLTNLIVAPAHRRQGHGSRFVKALAAQAKRSLYLSCSPPLLPLYTRLGFRPVSPATLSTALKYDLNLFSNAQVIPLVLHRVDG